MKEIMVQRILTFSILPDELPHHRLDPIKPCHCMDKFISGAKKANYCRTHGEKQKSLTKKRQYLNMISKVVA